MRTRLNVLILAGMLLPAFSARAQSPLPEISPEAVVNTFTAGSQTAPAVAASPSGSVWIAWIDKSDAPAGIKARHFDASGSPLSPEIRIRVLGFPNAPSAGPATAATAGGGFVVAWAETPNVWFRRFDADGAPIGAEQRIAPSMSFETITFPGVAVASDGSFVVTWLQSDLLNDIVQVQRFDPQGASLGALQAVATGSRNTLSSPRLAGAPDGGFLVVWQNAVQGIILARRYTGATGDGAAVAELNVPGAGFAFQPAAALAGDGSARVVWVAGDRLWIRRLSAAGEPEGPGVQVGVGNASTLPSAVAVDHDGNALVVGSDFDLALKGRLLKADLTPLSDPFPASDREYYATDPVLATTASGNLVLVWSSGFPFSSPFEYLPPQEIPGLDGDAQGVVRRIFAPVRCAAGSEVLCLGPGHRFEARVSWKNPNSGETGAGHSLPLTENTGAFWFFGDQNLELMVKVLDGTTVNLHFWVYAGALSNVEYTLTVTDTLTGVTRSYHNPAGQIASLADVAAFPPGVSAERTEEAARTPATAGMIGMKTGALVGCLPLAADPTSLCLASGHFTVSVQLTDPRTGLAGAATAVPLTGDTGAFWFFDDSNLELMIKVLDGRAVNGKYWVFYGALSDVDYTITVTRPETGEVRTYHNPHGTLASRADTQAF